MPSGGGAENAKNEGVNQSSEQGANGISQTSSDASQEIARLGLGEME